MNREQRRGPGRAPSGRVEGMPAESMVAIRPRSGGVSIEDRQGVWVHSFICNNCGLHFNVYSWLPDRHRAQTIWCPECGHHGGEFRHWRARISELAGEVSDSGPGEIFRHCQHPGASLMDDTTLDGLEEYRPR